MEYEIKGDLIAFSNGYKVEIIGLSSNLEGINIESYQQQAVDWELEKFRNKRSEEFSLYDKYQLPLVWQGLTTNQQQEYVIWRNDWLDVTETLIEPNRLSWFD